MSMLEEYRECAEICSRINYHDKKTIKANNHAVDKMYRIVEKAEKKGSASIAELATLLDESGSAEWLSYQLLERASVTPQIERKCLAIIYKLAMGENAEAMGSQMWLKNWYKKKNLTLK